MLGRKYNHIMDILRDHKHSIIKISSWRMKNILIIGGPYNELYTESTLVLGVDIGSSEHYVRAFDYRGRELTRKVFRFSTDINGFNSFYDWVTQICIKHGKNEAMIGCEPTGHYWYTFYQFVKEYGMKLVFYNGLIN